MPRPKDGKKPIKYLDAELYAGHFKKIFRKVFNSKKAHLTLKIFSRAISSHITNFQFLPFSGHFPMAKKNQKWFRARKKISCSWGEKNFAENPYFVRASQSHPKSPRALARATQESPRANHSFSCHCYCYIMNLVTVLRYLECTNSAKYFL